MAVHRELDEREERTWRAYRRMQSQVSRRIARDLAHNTGLSEAEYEILVALSEADGQRLRALVLRCALEWEKSRLSHQLRRMEQRGLVAREDCAEDARATLIRLTDKGCQAVIAANCERIRAIRAHLIDRLSPAQLAALADIGEAVLAAFDREDSSHRHTTPTR